MKTDLEYTPVNILLAEDDIDDLLFFDKALKEIPIAAHLTTVRDGEELMEYLFANLDHLPTILFLDLSMPRKTGFECLTEIKEDDRLKDLYVAMLSTSFPSDLKYEKDIVKMLYKIGAENFIRKPNDFSLLKKIIHDVIIKAIGKKSLPKQAKIFDKLV
jgi:CheY-like chemotaxis protein